MSTKKWQISDPEIQALFAGLYVSPKKVHFRINPDGTQVREGISAKLVALGISRKTATNLLPEAREQGLIKPGEDYNWDARQVNTSRDGKRKSVTKRKPPRRGTLAVKY